MGKINPKLKKLIKDDFHKNFADKKFVPGQTVIPASGKVFNEQEMQLMTEAVLDGWWTEGRFNKQFEKKIAQWLGRKFCSTTNSGSSANLLALTALTSFRLGQRRLKKGDEIITLAAAFPTTVNPIVQNNLVPVFVDIDLETYNADPEQIKKAIRPGRTRAIFLAHTLGNPFNLEKIVKLCQKYKLWLIEDNCDALGSAYQDKRTGSFGHLATQSFYPAHHMTTGEGGAVLTNDPLLHKIIRSLRDWGRDCWCPTGHDNTCGKRYSWKLGNLPKGFDHKYIYSEIGYNLKITDISAALGLVQLKKLNKFNQQRKKNFDFLYKKFKEFDSYFILPQKEKFSQPVWFGFPITLRDNCPFDRENLLKYLNNFGIGTRLIFGGNMIKQPSFVNYQIKFRKIGNLKNTDKIMNDSFWIGLYHGLGQKELSFVVKKFEDFIKKYKTGKNSLIM